MAALIDLGMRFNNTYNTSTMQYGYIGITFIYTALGVQLLNIPMILSKNIYHLSTKLNPDLTALLFID